MKYTNRKGDVYLLQAGKTRTGKPRYWCGRKLTGEPLESVPEGFEIFEHPEAALVTLRKKRPTEISSMETKLLSDAIRKQAGLDRFIVDVEGDSLVVYLPDTSAEDAERIFNKLAEPMFGMSSRMQSAEDYRMRNSNYDKIMRFDLINPDERYFVVRRWCFRGSIDDWIRLDGPALLPNLIHKYVQHLGQESFFELI